MSHPKRPASWTECFRWGSTREVNAETLLSQAYQAEIRVFHRFFALLEIGDFLEILGCMFRKRTVATLAVVAASLLLQYLPKTSDAFAVENWRVPLDNPALVRDFLQPSADWSTGHRGVDYLVNEGDPVFAPATGTVRFSGDLVNRSVVSIAHENGLISTVEPVCGNHSKGASVTVGEQIGSVCVNEGYFSHCGPKLCLHFGIKTESGYLSPLYKLGELSPSRLKPWDGRLRSFV